MKESDSRAGVLAAVDEARLDLEAAAEREHRARLAYEEALAAAVAAIGVTAVSRCCTFKSAQTRVRWVLVKSAP